MVKEARALLAVPAEVSEDLTHFTTDPRPMLEHRDRMARMIELWNGRTLGSMNPPGDRRSAKLMGYRAGLESQVGKNSLCWWEPR